MTPYCLQINNKAVQRAALFLIALFISTTSCKKATDEVLGEILVKLNFVTTDELADAIAFQNNLEYVDLDGYIPTPEVLKLIDKGFAMTNMVMSLKI